MERLAYYKQRYERAMKAKCYVRDFLLAELMTDMEREYRIPMLR